MQVNEIKLTDSKGRQLVTVKAAASLLSISRQRIRQYIKQDRLTVRATLDDCRRSQLLYLDDVLSVRKPNGRPRKSTT